MLIHVINGKQSLARIDHVTSSCALVVGQSPSVRPWQPTLPTLKVCLLSDFLFVILPINLLNPSWCDSNYYKKKGENEVKTMEQKILKNYNLTKRRLFSSNSRMKNLKKIINTDNKWHYYHFGKGCIEQKRDKKRNEEWIQ